MGNRSMTKMTEGGGVKSSFVLYPEAKDALEELLQEWPCWRRPKTEPLLRVVPTQN
jgi:hypothetical protein